jgi:hypothetical protein
MMIRQILMEGMWDDVVVAFVGGDTRSRTGRIPGGISSVRHLYHRGIMDYIIATINGGYGTTHVVASCGCGY